jgi:CBS domain-containing protein
MAQHEVGALVVLEGKRPVGIVTDRDLVLRVLAKGHNAKTLTLQTVMTTNLVCVPEHMAQEEALAFMQGYQVRRLVVVNAARELVGIFTLDDMLELLGQEQHAIIGLMRSVHRRQEEAPSGPQGGWHGESDR